MMLRDLSSCSNIKEGILNNNNVAEEKFHFEREKFLNKPQFENVILQPLETFFLGG